MTTEMDDGPAPGMDHDAARALMAAAIEGTLDDARERDLAVHLVGCAECKSLYSRLQQAEVALRGLAFSHPSTRIVDAAVVRATTVLRGEADPGPSGGVTPPAHTRAEDVDLGAFDEPAHAPIPVPAPVPLPPPTTFAPISIEEDVAGLVDDEPRSVRAIFGSSDQRTADDEATGIDEPEAAGPRVTGPFAALEAEHGDTAQWRFDDDVDSPGARPFSTLDDELTDEDLVLPDLPPRPGIEPPVAEERAEPIAAEPADIEATPDAPAPARRPPAPAATARRRRAGAGAWLAAITAAVVLALVAGFVITRSQTGGGATPTAAQVRDRVRHTFAQLRSLKASFTIRRLDLYPVSRSGATMQFSFSDGTTTGRLVFDRAEGFREESTTDVAGSEIATTRVAQTVSDLRTLQGTGGNAKLVIVRNPPLGPPDGAFHPALGSLDRAVGSVAQLIAGTSRLDVLGLRKTPDRQVVDIRLDVAPTELTRADRIDVALDARTYFPVHIRREISRSNGRVLAPESILGGAALQTAFANRDRILTEDTVISDLVVDDVILPGDFVLDVPQGASTQNTNRSFQRVPHADVASKLHFTPLFPQSVPDGYAEQSLAVSTGTPATWGPNGAYPAPDGILDVTYFDGKTTIVVTERHMPHGAFDLHGSPLTGTTTLPIQVTPQSRAEKTFYYATSPEVAPHAYGFLGDVFVMATGYAPADELVGIVASMGQASAPSATAPTASP